MKKSMDDIYRDHVLSSADDIELSYLAHHGILGQKWGVRRFQNKDGTRTATGKSREKDNLYIRMCTNKDGSLTEFGKQKYIGKDGDFHYPKDPEHPGYIRYTPKDIRVYNKYSEFLRKEAKSEFDDIISLKDKNQKTKLEKEYVNSAFSNDRSPSDRDAAKARVLADEYKEKCGNWYEGTSVTKEHDNYIKKLRAISDEKQKLYNTYYRNGRKNKYYEEIKKVNDRKQKLEDEMTSYVLKEIGFEDNPVIYESAAYIWRWD